MNKYHYLLFYVLLGWSSLFHFEIFTTESEANQQNQNSIIVKTTQIKLEDYPRAFNPSLIQTDNGLLLTFRVVGSLPNISYIGLVFLNDDFEPVSEPQLISPRTPQHTIPSQSEDARIFYCNGDLYLIYNDNDQVKNPTRDERRDMFIAKIRYEKDCFTVEKPLKLRHTQKYEFVKWQKNWVPFEWEGQILIGYSINPYEVLIVDLETGDCNPCYITKTPINWKFGHLRGGTPAFLYEGEYLAIFHSSIVTSSVASNNVPMMHYFMGAYTFQSNPPFNITKITQHPLIHPTFYTKSDMHLRAVFPGGFVISEPYIYVAYGKDDREIWIATININALQSALKPVINFNDASEF